MRAACLSLLALLPTAVWPSGTGDNRCTFFRPPTEASEKAWISQCQGVCGLRTSDQAPDITSISCISFTEDPDWQPYPPTGQEVLIGHCTCNSPFLASVASTFVDAVTAVAEFDEFLFKTIFEQVALLGVAFIPGVGQAIEGPLIAIITSAKVAEYTLGAARGLSAFANWLKPIGATTSDIAKVWNTVKGVSDDVLPGGLRIPQGLPRAKRDDGDAPEAPPPREQPRPTRPQPSKPEPTQPEPTNPQPTKPTQPEPTKPEPTKPEPTKPEPTKPEPTKPEPTKPEPTKPEPTKPEPTHPQPTKPTKSEPTEAEPTKPEPMKPEPTKPEATKPEPTATRPNAKQHHITSMTVKKWVRAAHPTTITELCNHKRHPQACYHYYSAAENNDDIDTRFSCREHHQTNRKCSATDDWSEQHKDVWNSFTRDDYNGIENQHPQGTEPDCQRNEWPPAYFVPPDVTSNDKECKQMVRYLPGAENGGAAQLWTGFCKRYDGQEGNGRFKRDRHGNNRLNEEAVNTENARSEIRKETHHGTTTTHTTYDTVTFSRAVFEMAFNWKTEDEPSEKNKWFLEENPCWPKDITPDDPGYVLLVTDKYYSHDASVEAVKMVGKYADTPQKHLVDLANERRKNDDVDPVEVTWSPPRKKGKHDNDNASGGDSGSSRRRFLARRQLQVLDDGFAIRSTNFTRRLSEEEVHRDIQAIRCSDSTCSQERKILDKNQAYAVMPPPAPTIRLPPPIEALATAVNTRVMTLETRTFARMTVSPNLPEATAI